MTFKLYGLLHLNDREQTAMNINPKSFQDQIELYIKNTITLSKSLQLQGLQFTLLTNNKNFITKILETLNETLIVEEIPFRTPVPSGIRFYSAHFKLDVFRYFSTKKQDEYMGLCDLDMVCINKIPQALLNNIEDNIPFFYDISDDVIISNGSQTIIRDLEILTGHRSEGRWSGGEFICGSANFFSMLIKEIDGIFDNYIENIGSFHHIGDEALTSAGLENLRKSGVYIADAGTLGIVGRYWSIHVLYYQRVFDYYQNCFLLHLPADKRFLAQIYNSEIKTSRDYIQLYLSYKNSLSMITTKYLKKLKYYALKVYYRFM